MLRQRLQYSLCNRLVFKSLFFLVIASGIVAGLSPTPPPTAAAWQSYGYHAGGLFLCTALSYPAFPRWRWFSRALLMSSLGISIELAQHLVKTRHTDITDLYANGLGIAASLLLCSSLRLALSKRSDI